MDGKADKKCRVLVLGASGMLGHVVFRTLYEDGDYEAFGTARARRALDGLLPEHMIEQVSFGVEATSLESVTSVLDTVAPDVVVNCVGVIKQAPSVQVAVSTIQVNSLFPHQLLELCLRRGIRLIHVSTDCVFSGEGGNYRESDRPDPVDLYGRSKLLGEISGESALTLRTSVVGRELREHRSLVDWFLSQTGTVAGYEKAIYSGLTTTEFAKMLADYVLPEPGLGGLYHVASNPISKFELLSIIAREYDWEGEVVPTEQVVCDRSLSADRFAAFTGYVAPPWPQMIAEMHACNFRWGGGT